MMASKNRKTRIARLSDKNREYLWKIKQKNGLKSLDEAVDMMRKAAEKNLVGKSRKIKIIEELDL